MAKRTVGREKDKARRSRMSIRIIRTMICVTLRERRVRATASVMNRSVLNNTGLGLRRCRRWIATGMAAARQLYRKSGAAKNGI